MPKRATRKTIPDAPNALQEMEASGFSTVTCCRYLAVLERHGNVIEIGSVLSTAWMPTAGACCACWLSRRTVEWFVGIDVIPLPGHAIVRIPLRDIDQATRRCKVGVLVEPRRDRNFGWVICVESTPPHVCKTPESGCITAVPRTDPLGYLRTFRASVSPRVRPIRPTPAPVSVYQQRWFGLDV